MFTTEQKELVVKGYIQAALWTTPNEDSEDNINDEDLLGFDVSSQMKGESSYICSLFINDNEKDCEEYLKLYKKPQGCTSEECLGHDLWLTSQGHGVGFWDRDLDELGERLSKNSSISPYAHKYCYLGDDLLVYLG